MIIELMRTKESNKQTENERTNRTKRTKSKGKHFNSGSNYKC